MDWVPGLGRYPEGEHGNTLQYSCLENSLEEPGGLQSIASQSVRHDWQYLAYTHAHHWYKLTMPQWVSQLRSKVFVSIFATQFLSTKSYKVPAAELRIHFVGLQTLRLDPFSSVQLLSCTDSLRLHELQHARPPCPSPTPGVLSNSCPLSRCCHPTISSSVVPFSSDLQFFPVSGSFPMSQFFASGGQSIGVSASASVFPMNTQYWFPLGWTGWISLQSKGLSRAFSNTTVGSKGSKTNPFIDLNKFLTHSSREPFWIHWYPEELEAGKKIYSFK